MSECSGDKIAERIAKAKKKRIDLNIFNCLCIDTLWNLEDSTCKLYEEKYRVWIIVNSQSLSNLKLINW